MRLSKGRLLLVFYLSFLVPSVASANAGVPMIFLVMPVLGFSIVPIILIEAVFLRKRLRITLGRSIKVTTVSNLASTLVGVPLTWLLLVFVQMLSGGGRGYGLDTILGKVLSVTLQAAWLIPYESELHWMVPLAGLVLLVPFFFVSWWSEYFISRMLVREHPAKKIRMEVCKANIITYVLLSLWPISYWVMNNPTS